MPASRPDRPDLARLADQCVRCGLCLPYCPTYAVGREEGESPRGRIALAKGLAEGRLEPTPALIGHLDSCLACGRCEAVCPADVRYGELIDGTRALPALQRARPRWRRLVERSLVAPARRGALLRLRRALGLLRPWWRTGQGPWARRARLLAGLPPVPEAAPTPARGRAGEATAPVLLFRGCVADPFEAGLRDGARRLYAALGLAVADGPAGLCCGSLAGHGGDASTAVTQADTLVAQLQASGTRTLLGTASGCQARLDEVLARSDTASLELHVHLAAQPGLDRLRFAPLPARVAVQQPCTQRQLGAASAAAVERLLALIPGLQRVDLPAQDRCCGAAGSQFLGRPAQAETLRDRVLADLGEARPELLVSSNIGCRLFLHGGLAASGRTMPVLHPVELLVRQWLP